MEWLFWLMLGAVAHAYLGYPVLLWLAVRVRGRRALAIPPIDAAFLPRVSILLPACNDAARLRRRLENLLALRYPRDRMEIVVGSDGSTDAAATVA